MLRKIKRNMAQTQFKSEGKTRVNARERLPGSPSGKMGANKPGKICVSSSDFALGWKEAYARRVKEMKQKEKKHG